MVHHGYLVYPGQRGHLCYGPGPCCCCTSPPHGSDEGVVHVQGGCSAEDTQSGSATWDERIFAVGMGLYFPLVLSYKVILFYAPFFSLAGGL